LDSFRQRLRSFLLTHVSLRLAIGLALSALCLWLFAKLADSVIENESLVQFDLALANFLHANAQPGTINLLRFITDYGPRGMWGLGILVALFWAWRRAWLEMVVWIAAFGGGELLNLGLKAWFARPRPTFTDPIIVANFFSFPSGHAMMSIIGYGMLTYFALLRVQSRWVRFAVVLVATILIILIGYSRLYLGVHFFSDVAAGFAAGGLWLITCIGGLEFIRQRKISLA
jgi:membrane-associated phospholipid phosphatase